MAQTGVDLDEFGRACELAWQQHLERRDYMVTPLCEAVGNVEGRRAPLIGVGGGAKVRAPDFSTEHPSGKSEYWEVKGRSRPHQDSATGELVHYTDLARFEDYERVCKDRKKDVWLVVFEAATATAPSRWLKIHVDIARQCGYREVRRDRHGKLAPYWNWPASRMEVVDGPPAPVFKGALPVVVAEIDLPAPGLADLSAVERVVRDQDRQNLPIPATGLAAMVAAQPEVGLDALRQRLGLHACPRYSVLRVGKVAADDLSGLLHYGIRVFLVVSSESVRNQLVNAPELAAFEQTRLLECGVAPQAGSREGWFVDGVLPPGNDWLDKVLQEADDHGGINVQQYRIVHKSVDSDVVVSAGAGTGKTETMAERILFLLSTARTVTDQAGNARAQAVGLHEIALVTFTREAAGTMRKRIARTLGLRQRLCRRCVHPTSAWLMQLGACRISTIHMFAKSVLGEFGHSIGFAPGFRVSDLTMQFRSIRDSEISRITTAEGIFLEKWPGLMRDTAPPFHEWSEHVDELWESLGNNGVNLLGDQSEIDWGSASGDPMQARAIKAIHAIMSGIGTEFAKVCRQEQSIPSSQLVQSAVRSLEASGEPGRCRPLRFLFVDEFQDTDELQMRMLLQLRHRMGVRLFVVGDSKQGIYRFRGASGDAFSLLKRQADARGLGDLAAPPGELTRNFRSGRKLLEDFHKYFMHWGSGQPALLSYVQANKLRHDPLRSRESSTVEQHVVAVQGDFASEAADLVARWRSDSSKKGLSIGVLCRRNSHARAVARALQHEHQGIGFRLVIGGEFFTSESVHATRALVEAVVAPSDDAAVLELLDSRWANGLLRSHDQLPDGLREGRDAWSREVANVADWPSRFASLAGAGRYDRLDIQLVRDRLVSLAAYSRSVPALAFLLECFRLLQPGKASLNHDELASERKRFETNFFHLVALMEEGLGGGAVALTGVLSWLKVQMATNRDEDEPKGEPSGEARLDIMTVHRAKGDEFDLVLIPNTWTPYGRPRSVKSSVVVDEAADGKQPVRWRWKVPGESRPTEVTVQNTCPRTDGLWRRDSNETSREEARLLYVAMTRARRKLVVFTLRSPPKQWCWMKLLSLQGGGAP